MSWHLASSDLAAYAAGELTPPALWSVEAHVASCAECRGSLASIVGPDLVDAGWERLDASLDAPRPGVVERTLVALGVPEHTGRLLAATPALRGSWLTAVAVTLLLAALLAHYVEPVVFLALTPLLPLIGVAVSFGPGIDPTYETTVVAPFSTFRLLLLRCAAVLSVNTVLATAASLSMAEYGIRVVGWFLPSLALTILTLLLTPRFGAVPAAAVVGLGWFGAVLSSGGLNSTSSAPYSVAGQSAIAAAAVAAALALRHQIAAFDRARPTVWRSR
ncbi:zf-HC2 domain-containing protein [Cryptosporangium aurantiacum]|uniref:Putative zinc-finger n=1 Tax=Cryptosporangium aurantiacum TaxID=134849 RepID=A0A1M7RDY2_9ACTN|nr:zf-HC2 domain-containing protein [Cryptosporangium aurantiacum]SHN44391.1 Putative zinc-finger [Cryptosporangium aurantiacum]